MAKNFKSLFAFYNNSCEYVTIDSSLIGENFMLIVDIEDYSLARVHFYLKHLRRGHAFKEQGGYIRQVRVILRSLGLSLEDVGTSETEILDFIHNGHLNSALHVLSLLRCGVTDPEMELQILEGHMRAAGLSYEDLHTTEELVKNYTLRITQDKCSPN